MEARRPPTAPLAAVARPHLILRPERARPWYAERMGSVSSPAQLWSRARPADARRAWSPRRAFAHLAGGGAGRARSHGVLVQRHGLFVRLGSRLRRAATYRARGTRGMCPATALGASQRMCTCSPFTTARCSIRCSSAPAPRPPSPPSLAARLPSSPSPPPALFQSFYASSRCRSAAAGS